MIFVDSHVHMYDCFDVETLLDSASDNFQQASAHYNSTGKGSVYVLLLTETKNENWFEHTLRALQSEDTDTTDISKNWRITGSENPDVLIAKRCDSVETRIYIVSGFQIVTKEKIEVLALYSRQRISDGLSLTETIDHIVTENAVPVLPWGAGKWLGERGKTIETFLNNSGKVLFYLGDNGGRPGLWPTPTLFSSAKKKGVSVLPGTDALPLENETGRAGSFGFFLKDTLVQGEDPGNYVKNVLLSQELTVSPFGRLQKNSQFLFNQLRLRFSA